MGVQRLLGAKQVQCRARNENSTLGEQSWQEAGEEKWELWRELGAVEKRNIVENVRGCSLQHKRKASTATYENAA